MGGFVLAAAFGAIAQRTHFCTMGAVSDIVVMGDWTRMRMWLLAIGVAMVGFNAMVWLGWVDPASSLYGGTRFMWLSALVGGAMFGFGMVFASGCASKTLVRVGGGNLKALVVAIVLGLSAIATLKGLPAVARVASVDTVYVNLPAQQDLPSLAAHAFGAPRAVIALALGALMGGGLIAWALARPEGRRGETLLAGFGIGAIVVAVWWLSGVLGFVAEDPNTLEPAFLATNSRRMESLSFVAPVGYALDWLMVFSDASNRLTLGIVAVAGMVAGSAAQALASGHFRWEAFRGVQDTADHLLGAMLMGIGGVTALGCTIGQGISGVSTLGLTSFVALAAILAGAVGALRLQAWRIERGA
ncbi:MAG: YeeE/YedE family protein [Burkholderiaceae bacterium]|nr:YeeE/YedE family protein [Burkholderiaceae bacterium]